LSSASDHSCVFDSDVDPIGLHTRDSTPAAIRPFLLSSFFPTLIFVAPGENRERCLAVTDIDSSPTVGLLLSRLTCRIRRYRELDDRQSQSQRGGHSDRHQLQASEHHRRGQHQGEHGPAEFFPTGEHDRCVVVIRPIFVVCRCAPPAQTVFSGLFRNETTVVVGCRQIGGPEEYDQLRRESRRRVHTATTTRRNGSREVSY